MSSTKSAPINMDAIRLTLIRRNGETLIDNVTPEEVVTYLVQALEYADAQFSVQIENILLRMGERVIPSLLQGLLSENTNVKSVCSMVLIRLGHVTVPHIQGFYKRNSHRSNLRWVVEFVLGQLSTPLAEASEFEHQTTGLFPLETLEAPVLLSVAS